MAVPQRESLKAIGLRKKFGRREVVRGVDLEAFSGEVVGLLGPNGAGKTTTFSMLAGFIRPAKGEIHLNENRLTKLPAYKRARNGLVYLPQEPSVFQKLTVEDNVRAIVETLSLTKEDQDSLVQKRLKDLNLEHLSSQKAYTLRGGERRRLEITRALSLSPKFLLLDEPFSGVDPISVNEVTSIILELKSQGIGIFLTDHNVRETLRAVDRAYLLYDGKVLAHGNANFLLSDPETRDKYLGSDFKI